MDTLNALDYLMNNGVGGSEWQEAGMYHACCAVCKVADRRKLWTRPELDKLIRDAEDN